MEFYLHPAQKQILSSLARFRILVCGRKFGKTTLAAEEIKDCAFAKANKRILYLSPTLGDSRTLMWDRLKNKVRGLITYENDSRLELKVKTQDNGETQIFLGSWEKIQDYRGDEFDFVIPDEVQDYKDFWTGWHEALRPTLSPRKGSALFMGTPKGFNHLYDLFNLEAKDKDYKSFHFTSYDNPFIDKAEIEKAKLELTEDRFAQEYLADFRKTEGLVYKAFDRKKHLFDDLNIKEVELIGGVDFGFHNPAAVPSIKKDKDGTYWVISTWKKTGRTDRQIAEYVASCNFNRVYPDPESAGGIEELHQHNVPVMEVMKGKDSVRSGITKISELLKQNRLRIHRSCLDLIEEFETYSYPDKRIGHNEEENPIKENDHLLDALRYTLTMNDPKPEKQSEPEEEYQPTYESIGI